MNISGQITNECNQRDHLVFRFVPTMRCNFRCSYCFLKHSDGKEPTMFDTIPVGQWLGGLRNFSDYDLDIYMWGGEPFCIPSTYELVKGLDELDFVKWMRIDTNLSYAKRILSKCPTPKLRLNCSWHTERFNYATVKKRMTQLHKHNMVGMLNFVASDVNLAYLKSNNLDLDTIIRDFWDMGIYMNVAADFNKGSDPEYYDFITRYMTVEDWNHIHGEYPSGQVQCDAGDHFFTIEHGGSLTSCGRVKQTLYGKKEFEIVGNLFSGDLVRRQTCCPRNSCLSLVSYCHRMDNTFSCRKHLDDYVRRSVEHRIKTGLLSGQTISEKTAILSNTQPRVIVPHISHPIQDARKEIPGVSLLSSGQLFQKAQEQFSLGNMVSAQRLHAQYKKAMDYNLLNVKRSSPQNASPLMSVVIVTYNRPDEAACCVDLLRKQRLQDFEIIVVDNGDPGKKAAALAKQVDVYVDCPMNFNLSEGRNIGAFFANGQILVFLDDDALVRPDYLESIRKAFEQYEILGLRGRAFPRNGQKADTRISVYDLGEEPFALLCNQEGNSAFRRDAYLAVGGMDAMLFGHEGSDMSYRLMRQYNHPSAVIYWPGAVIYHDYGTENTIAQKDTRYARNRNYLRYKHDIDVIGLKEQIKNNALMPNQSGQLLPPLPGIQPTIPSQQVSATPPGPNGPKVSIVMACHNAAQFLVETIETILGQTLKDWELLVTDDGSTDTTGLILKNYAAKDQRIRLWFFDDQKGPYVRRNFAIQQARAPFICIQDADDLMAANKLEILYDEINRDERLGIVGSFFRRFLDTFQGADFGDRMEKRITHQELMEAFPGSWHLCWHGSALIRKSLFDIIGPYDEQPYGSDTFWLSKAGLYGFLTGCVRFRNIPEYLTYKREHAQSQTGKISPADPRSRRHRLERYYLQKLQQVADQAKTNPSINIAQKIKECTCTDFIPKFQHLFDQWESAPVNDTMIQGLINRGISQFSSEQYVSALITLNCLDQMVSGGCQFYRNLNFTRGLAYYASGDDVQAAKNIQKEIQLSQNQNAELFLAQYLAAPDPAVSAAERRANIHRFIAAASQKTESQNGLTPSQEQLIDPESYLQERLALAKYYLYSGKPQEALCVYRGLLSDNKLAGQIELKEKLSKLVETILLVKESQMSLESRIGFSGDRNNL